MAHELPPLRRVVTGINASGKTAIVADGPPPAVRRSTRPGVQSSNIWATFASPAPIDAADRSGEIRGSLPPPKGTLIKFIDFPPEPRDPTERERKARETEARRPDASIEPGLRRHPESPIHPGMQEADSIDYAVVLCGEIVALMEEGETLLQAGDVLVQRGTNHAWSNRSDKPCRLLLVLVDAARCD